jgi:hypothetical protein
MTSKSREMIINTREISMYFDGMGLGLQLCLRSVIFYRGEVCCVEEGVFTCLIECKTSSTIGVTHPVAELGLDFTKSR